MKESSITNSQEISTQIEPEQVIEHKLLETVRTGINLLNKTALAIVHAYSAIKDKIIDISPDFLISADEVIKEFEAQRKESVDLSRTGGQFFDYIAKNTINKPTKEYVHTFPQSTLLGLTKVESDYLARIKGEYAKKSDQIRNIRHVAEMIDGDSNTSEPDYHEIVIDKATIERFSRSIPQVGGANSIGEIVENVLIENANSADSKLLIKNKQTNKIIELNQLLPTGYSFAPSSMHMIKRDYAIVDNQRTERIYRIPKNLKDYKGTEVQDRSFFAVVPSMQMIEYGNLAKKGGILSLLHEIAHSWQEVNNESFGRHNFEDYCKKIERSLYGIHLAISDIKNTEPGDDSEIDIEFNESWIQEKLSEIDQIEIDSGLKKSDDAEEVSIKDGQFKFLQLTPDEDIGFALKSKALADLVKDYVRQERDAWAHAIRVLRFFRKQGIDLEPELKTLKDIQEQVHYCLGTYQIDLEKKLEVPGDLKKFTTNIVYDNSLPKNKE